MLNVLLSAPLFFQLFSDIAKQKSNSSEDPNSDDDFISTKSFRTNDVPKSANGNTLAGALRRVFSFNLLQNDPKNDEKKTSCFLICFCCISLQFSFHS